MMQPARPQVESVVLVDTEDGVLGSMPKLDAHQPPGHLHRAISVFVYSTSGRMLLQRRAATKYHFAGLWANAACSHPTERETPVAAGERRLREEMGLVVPLIEEGTFTYRAEDPVSGLVEHEFDHVIVGVCDDDPRPDMHEADAWDWVSPAELAERLADNSEGFAPWLAHAFAAIPNLADASRLGIG
jgi:isopentenyl-diphosphate delta-isomerase